MARLDVGSVVITPQLEPAALSRVKAEISTITAPHTLTITTKLDTASKAAIGGLDGSLRAVKVSVDALENSMISLAQAWASLPGGARAPKTNTGNPFREEQAAVAQLKQELNTLRIAWQTARPGTNTADIATEMTVQRDAIRGVIAALEQEKAALTQKATLTEAETVRVRQLTALLNGYAQAERTAASVLANMNGEILRGSLADGVRMGTTAALNTQYRETATAASLLVNQERAGLITKAELVSRIEIHRTAMQGEIAVIQQEIAATRARAAADAAEAVRLQELIALEGRYTAALAAATAAQTRAAAAQRANTGLGAFARGAGMGNAANGAALGLSFISPEAGMIASLASMGPATAAVGALGLAVAGVVHLTKDGQVEAKKLQQAYLVMAANGIKDIGAVNAQLDEMVRTGSDAIRMFSKAELAQGLAGLARGGVKGADGLKVLEVGAKLAAAEHIKLDVAVERLYGNLQHLDMTADQASTFGDKLARASHMSMATMDNLSKGLNVVGATGHKLGFELDEMLAALVRLAQKGMDPATVGSTGLRNALQLAMKPSKEASLIYEQLGVKMRDSTGHMRSGRDIIMDLQAVFSSTRPIYNQLTGDIITQNDLAGMAFKIFGTRSATAFLSVLGNLREMTEEIEHSKGFLNEYSGKVVSGLEGAQKRLDAATKNLSATFAKVFTPALASAAEGLADFMSKYVVPTFEKLSDFNDLLKGTRGPGEIKLSVSVEGKDGTADKVLEGARANSFIETAARLHIDLAKDDTTTMIAKFLAGTKLAVQVAFEQIGQTAPVKQGQQLSALARASNVQEQLLDLGVLTRGDVFQKYRQLQTIMGDLEKYEAMLRARLAKLEAGAKNPGAGVNPGNPLGLPGVPGVPTMPGLPTLAGGPFGGKTFGTTFGFGATAKDGYGFGRHNGIDYAAPLGTPIFAEFTGRVERFWDREGGQVVRMTDAAGQQMMYMHLKKLSDELEAALKAGGGKAMVKFGTLLAYTGGDPSDVRNSGVYTTGAHLHREARDARGRAVDPNTIRFQPFAEPVGGEDGHDHEAPNSASTRPDLAARAREHEAAVAKLNETARKLVATLHAATPGTTAWDNATNAIKAFTKGNTEAATAIAGAEKAYAAQHAKLKDLNLSLADWGRYQKDAIRLQRDLEAAEKSGDAAAKIAADNRIASWEARGTETQQKAKQQAISMAAWQLNHDRQANAERTRAEAERTRDAEQAAAKRASLEEEAARLSAQLTRESEAGKLDAARATLERLRGVRDQQVADAGDDAREQLRIAKSSAEAIRAASVEVARAEGRERLATAEETRRRQKETADKLLAEGTYTRAQYRAELGRIDANYDQARVSSEATVNAAIEKARGDAARSVSAATKKVQAEEKRTAEETSRQLVALTQKQLGEVVKAREGEASRLRTQRDREIAAAGNDADRKLAIERSYQGRIQQAEQSAAAARLVAAKRAAEEEQRATVAAIPVGASKADRERIEGEARRTYLATLGNAYRTYYREMGTAAEDGADRVRDAMKTVSDALDKGDDAGQAAEEWVKSNAAQLGGRELAAAAEGASRLQVSFESLVRAIPKNTADFDAFLAWVKDLEAAGRLAAGTYRDLSNLLNVLKDGANTDGTVRRTLRGDNLEGRGIPAGKTPDLSDPANGGFDPSEREGLLNSFMGMDPDALDRIVDREIAAAEKAGRAIRPIFSLMIEARANIAQANSELLAGEPELSHLDEGLIRSGRNTAQLSQEVDGLAKALAAAGQTAQDTGQDTLDLAGIQERLSQVSAVQLATVIRSALAQRQITQEQAIQLRDAWNKANGAVPAEASEFTKSLEAEARKLDDLVEKYQNAELSQGAMADSLNDLATGYDAFAEQLAGQGKPEAAEFFRRGAEQARRMALDVAELSKALDVEETPEQPIVRKPVLTPEQQERADQAATVAAGAEAPTSASLDARSKAQREFAASLADTTERLRGYQALLKSGAITGEQYGRSIEWSVAALQKLAATPDIGTKQREAILALIADVQNYGATLDQAAQNAETLAAREASALDWLHERGLIGERDYQAQREGLAVEAEGRRYEATLRGLNLTGDELQRALKGEEVGTGLTLEKVRGARAEHEDKLADIQRDGVRARDAIAQQELQARLAVIDRELELVEQRRAAASPTGTNFGAEREALGRSTALRIRRAQEVYDAEVKAAKGSYDEIDAAYTRLQIALGVVAADGSRTRQEIAARELNEWKKWVDAAGQIVDRINGGKTSFVGLAAGALSSGLSAAEAFTRGDVVGGVMAIVDGVDKLLSGILELDEGFQKWKTSLLEVADAERQVANAGAGLFKNPFKDALNKDAGAREENAKADFLTRAWWFLTGTQPKYMDDAAADVLRRKGELFNAIGGDFSNTLESTLFEAVSSGDWSKVGDALDKSLTETTVKAIIHSLLVAALETEKFQGLVTKLVEAVRSGDKAAIKAAQAELRAAALALGDEVKAATDGLFDADPAEAARRAREVATARTNSDLKALEYLHSAGLVSEEAYQKEKYRLTVDNLAREHDAALAAAGDNLDLRIAADQDYNVGVAKAAQDRDRAIAADRIRQNQAALDLMGLQLDASYRNGEISTQEYEARRLQLALARLDEEEAAALNAEGLTEAEKTRIHAEFVQKRADAENAARDALLNSWSGAAGQGLMAAIEGQDFSKFEANLKQAFFRAAVEGLVAGLASDIVKAQLIPLAQALVDARKTPGLEDDAAAIDALRNGISGAVGDFRAVYDVFAPLAAQFGFGQDKTVNAINKTTEAVQGVQKAVEDSQPQTTVQVQLPDPGLYLAGTRTQANPYNNPTM